MTRPESGQWRDDKRLPLSELDEALASYSQDGQLDDATGGDAGAEAAFGDGAVPRDGDPTPEGAGDPDPDSEAGRRVRPSPDGTSSTGRSGPS